jgi:hypothetical protein
MKTILTLIALCSLSTCYADVSKEQMQATLDRLTSHIVARTPSGFTNLKPVTLQFDKWDSSVRCRAYHDQRLIVCTDNMTLFLQNTDEAAIILGHELGHLEIGKDEVQADRFGIDLAKLAGYNTLNTKEMWVRMYELTGVNDPDLKERLRMM